MEVFCKGTARIAHHDSGEVFQIEADVLDWEVADSSERSMGPSTHYEATFEHPKLGPLSWSVWEYPVGAENMRQTEIGRHTLVEDFDFGLAHTSLPEEDAEKRYFSEVDQDVGVTENELLGLSAGEQVPYLVHWFHSMYWDPAHETPYNGREGGYLYIHGGPYDASEELFQEFESIAHEWAIEKAVEEVESDGIFDWAPSPNHPDQQAVLEELEHERWQKEHPTLEELRKRLKDGVQPRFGGDEEKQKRQQLRGEITELGNLLNQSRSKHGGIGHNQPPEELAIDRAEVYELSIAVNVIDTEISKEAPSAENVAQATGNLKGILSFGAKKLGLTLDAFLTQIGKRTADAAFLVGGGLALGYWDAVWAKVHEIYQLSLNWLDFITSLF